MVSAKVDERTREWRLEQEAAREVEPLRFIARKIELSAWPAIPPATERGSSARGGSTLGAVPITRARSAGQKRPIFMFCSFPAGCSGTTVRRIAADHKWLRVGGSKFRVERPQLAML